MAISCTTAYRGRRIGTRPGGLLRGRIAETVSFADPARLTDTGKFMNQQPDEPLPISKLRHIDRVCDRFEAALKAGEQVAADDFLGDTKEPERSALKKELEAVGAQFQKSANKEGQPAGPPKDPGVAKFVRRLVESRLMTDDEVKEFLDGLPEDENPNSAEDLAKALYRRKRLTRFQTQAVFQGRTRGLVLGKYEVLEKIGSGGMGHVYKARHKRMRREVALKVLPTAVSRDKEAVGRFQREVMAAAQLDHPNIVAAYDADEDNGAYFLVMQHVDGLDLAKLVQTRGTLTVGKALDYITQAAKGLEYAHSKGLIHRDIKPANLLWDKSGTIRVLDMGLARFGKEVEEATAARSLTQNGQVMGTLDYMAPEQAIDTHTVDARADVYSLGCTLHYLLTGEPVYMGRTMASKFLAHREQPVPSLRTQRDDVPEGLDAVFQRMLAKRPEDRQQSMTELLVELESCCAERDEFAETVSLAAPVDTGTLGATAKESDSGDSALDAWLHARPDSAPTLFHLNPKKENAVNRQRLIYNLVAAGIAFVALLLTITIIIRTPKGTLIVEVSEPGAKIEVDGEEVTITTPDDKERVKVRVADGEHTLKISKGGFRTYTRQFTIESGGKESISVELMRPEVATASQPPPQQPADLPTAFGQLIETLDLGDVEVWSPVFGPDGTALAATAGKELKIWDLPGLQPAGSYTTNGGHGLVFSPDGSTLVTTPGPQIFDLETGNRKGLEFRDYLGYGLDFSKDGSQIACGFQDGTVRLIDAKTYAVRKEFETGIHRVSDICLSPDGTRLAICGFGGADYHDGGLAVWDLEAVKPRQLWGVSGKEFHATVFSADGESVLANCDDEIGGNGIHVWDLATGEMLKRVFRHAGVQEIALSPDGRLLASASCYHHVKIFDMTTGKELAHLTGHTETVKGVAFSPDGSMLASCSPDGTVKLWNVARNQPSSKDVSLASEPKAPSAPPKTWPADAPPLAVAPFDAAQAEKHQQAWADYLGLPVESENSIGIKMVLIPPGEFLMGSNAEEQARFLEEATAAEPAKGRIPPEGPQHRVRITRPFALSRHEVTRGQFRQFVEQTGYKTEAEQDGKGGHGLLDGEWAPDPRFVWSAGSGDDRPVVNVSWNDATAFCQWLSKEHGLKYHLPTEAQWEYACRAGTTTFWHSGDSDWNLRKYAWFGANSGGKSYPVGLLKPNAWDLCDMHGNMFELCADWYAVDYYAQSPPNDPSGPTAGSRRVSRGGSVHHLAGLCRSANRHYDLSDYRSDDLGFRLASVLTDE